MRVIPAKRACNYSTLGCRLLGIHKCALRRPAQCSEVLARDKNISSRISTKQRSYMYVCNKLLHCAHIQTYIILALRMLPCMQQMYFLCQLQSNGRNFTKSIWQILRNRQLNYCKSAFRQSQQHQRHH